MILSTSLVIDEHPFTNLRRPAIGASIVDAHDAISTIGHLIHDTVKTFRTKPSEIVAFMPHIAAVCARSEIHDGPIVSFHCHNLTLDNRLMVATITSTNF